MLTIYKRRLKIDVRYFFTAGMKVEVDMEKTRLRNSWYVATIITPPAPPPPDFVNPNKRPYYTRLRYKLVVTVEYDNLMEEDGVTKLRETIDVVQIRPIPPMEKEGEVEFDVKDKVDVYIEGGWWEGVIKEALCHPNEFEVHFKDSRILSCFYAKELRVHREWHDGDWVPPLLVEDEKKKCDDEASDGKGHTAHEESSEASI